MSLVTWSWIFLAIYIAGMIAIGLIAHRRIKHADDFATARGSYGPIFLALAFAASTASGATFLGSPGLSYQWGMSSVWGAFLYPAGVYFGVLISMRLIAKSGNRFGNRSIPEYLGDRYQSEGIRVLVSLFSLVLFFYIAGQLVSGLVMFETMLGLPPMWALIITTSCLAIYVVLGGAHADIMTDGLQGFLMLLLAVLVIVLFLLGFGIEGGFSGMLDSLKEQDEALMQPLNQNTPLYHSPWSIFAILIAHIPLGLLPHLGNKLWALKSQGDQKQFIKLAAAMGLTLGMLGLGGILARALLGDVLLETGSSPNESLPLLFIELFPAWLAALIGIGVLSAIMSTADGLVISSSQIIANDLYRRTIAPRLKHPPDEETLDRQVLLISRWSTAGVLLITTLMAWSFLNLNVALLVWIGTGGMMAAFAGPLVMGALWKGVTRAGAYTGLVSGMGVFIVLHTQMLNPAWFSGGLADIVQWLYTEGPNPYSCAAMGELVSVTLTYTVSRLTRVLPKEHLAIMFDEDPVEAVHSVG